MPPTTNPPQPLPSSTVVVLRDREGQLEVLLVLRHDKASFGASYVFPGGVQETADCKVGALCDGASDAEVSAAFGLAEGGLAYCSAALRELFEETGILLARHADGAATLVADDRLQEHRDAIHSGALDWCEFLRQHNLRLACDLLHYFAYWVTPRDRPKRFSTRFFAMAMPGGQVARHDGKELTDSRWMSPAAALEAAASRELVLPPPTRAVLTDLAAFESVAAALDWARAAGKAGVDCVLPATVGEGKNQKIVLPGNPGYPADHQGCEE
jgi:8-oxo-dGTP pyrophosphatase MutT (NUDIX family)